MLNIIKGTVKQFLYNTVLAVQINIIGAPVAQVRQCYNLLKLLPILKLFLSPPTSVLVKNTTKHLNNLIFYTLRDNNKNTDFIFTEQV